VVVVVPDKLERTEFATEFAELRTEEREEMAEETSLETGIVDSEDETSVVVVVAVPPEV